VLDVCEVAPLGCSLGEQVGDYVFVGRVTEPVLRSDSEIMRLDCLLCGPVFEKWRERVALRDREVTFLGGSAKESGIRSGRGSLGGYLIYAGTMSLGRSAAL